MKSVRYRCAIILVLAFAGTSVADVFHTVDHPLSRDDLAAVEAVACMSPHGVKIDSAIAYDFRGQTFARARCRNHGSVDGKPLHYHVTCSREADGWRCFNTLEYLRAKIGSKELFLVAPRERMSEAFGATKYLVETGRFDLQQAGMFEGVQLKDRTVYHVHVEPAGERAVRIQKHLEWLYVERLPTGGYRELTETEAAPLAAQIEAGRLARAAVYDYLWSYRQGYSGHIGDAFLPTARIEAQQDGKIVSFAPDEYRALFMPAEDDVRHVRSIDYSDVAGDAATVKVVLECDATVLTEFLLLLKVDGRWKIANAVQSSFTRPSTSSAPDPRACNRAISPGHVPVSPR
jgi:hypothetical protein